MKRRRGRPSHSFTKNNKDFLEKMENQFNQDTNIYFDRLFSYKKESILESLGENEYEQKENFKQIIHLTQEIINNCDNKKVEAYKNKTVTKYISKLFIPYLESFNQTTGNETVTLKESESVALDLALNCNINFNINDFGISPSNLTPYLKMALHGIPKGIFSIRAKFESAYNQDPFSYNSKHQEILDTENELFLYITKSWKKTVEDVSRSKYFFKFKRILLCKDSLCDKYKELVVKNRNIQYKKMDSNIFTDYLDFLCSNVFNKESFWKILDSTFEEMKQEYLNSELTTALQEKYKNNSSILNLFHKIPLCNGDKWFCPKDANTVFEENFFKYRYQFFFYEIYPSFLVPKESRQFSDDKLILPLKDKGENILIQNYLHTHTGFSSIYNGETLESRMRFKFCEWNTHFNIGKFSDSMLHQILWEFLVDSKGAMKETISVTFDKIHGYNLVDKTGHRLKKLWGISESALDKESYQIDSYFSYEYQIKQQNLSATKEKRFGPLLDDRFYMMECTDFTEIYNMEDKKQLFTAWKLYDIVRELVSWPNKNPNNKELNKSVYKLSRTIGNIRDLEMRISILDEFSEIIPQIKAGNYGNAQEFILQMAEIIDDLSEEFNRLHDEMFYCLVWQFAKEDRWKHLLWMKNRETEGLSQLIDKVNRLKNGQGNDKSLQNFRELYYMKKAAGAKYSLYQGILTNLQDGYSKICNL